MDVFTLDALQADKGDALVLRWGTQDAVHIALIDGGPPGVFDDSVWPHLTALAGTNPLGEQNQVELPLVVVSHVDEDHIAGVIDLVQTIRDAQQQPRTPPAKIGDVWHNSFADMAFLAEFADEPDLVEAMRSVATDPQSLTAGSVAVSGDPTIGDITAGAASVRQGRRLQQLLNQTGVTQNSAFAGRDGFVVAAAPVSVEGVEITVIAPSPALLAKLKQKWKSELADILKKERDKRKAAVQALSLAFDDRSIPNQSSIVILAEFGGRTMLLTGDARGDHLMEALNQGGNAPRTPLHVDLFKVPHHGSKHSNGRALFQAVTADHYVISGNGEHGNPHADTLEALFETQRGRPIAVHLTNHPEDGAKTATDLDKAHAAQKVLNAAEADNDVTILYRNDTDLAVTIPLLALN